MNVLGMPDDVERCYKLIDSPKHVQGDVTCCDHLLGESAPVEWWIFRFRNAKQPARTSGHVCAPAHGGTWRDIRVPYRAPADHILLAWDAQSHFEPLQVSPCFFFQVGFTW